MTNLIPTRNLDSITGSQFAAHNMSTLNDIRENNILDEILNGNIPDFLRNFVPIEITFKNHKITYLTMPNYISLGSNDDFLIIPINALTAQKICDKFDMSLPTKLMVNQIYNQAYNKLEPKPYGPPYNSEMMSMRRYVWSNDQISKQMVNRDITKLTGGHKKDLILTNELSPNNLKKRVCIYGWHELNGVPIQGKNYWSHEVTYFDYSQTARFIANDIMIDNSPARLQDLFKDPNLHQAVSDEGILTFLRY